MTTAKGGRPATGAIKWQYSKKYGRDCWHGRVTLADKSRPWVPLDPSIPPEDEARARVCAIETAQWFKENPSVDASVKETVSEYATAWVAYRKNTIRTSSSEAGHLKHHILPVIGGKDLRTLEDADGDKLVAALDKKIADKVVDSKTAQNIWATAKKMLKDAAHAKEKTGLRRLKTNPFANVTPPDRAKSKKALQFLYPSELEALLTSEAPLYFRRYAAIAVHLGLRDGEQRVLQWSNVDLEHRVLQVEEAYDQHTKKARDGTKNESSRTVPIPERLFPLLERMQKESGGTGLVCPKMFGQPSMARALRTWLRNAGVTRPQLFQRTPYNRPIRWHDLRATTATWLAVQKADPTEIRDVLGHSDAEMTNKYTRRSLVIRGGAFGEPFAPLPDCLLGLSPVRPGTNSDAKSSLIHEASSGAEGNRTPDLLHAMQALSQLSYSPGSRDPCLYSVPTYAASASRSSCGSFRASPILPFGSFSRSVRDA